MLVIALGLSCFAYALVWIAPDILVWLGWPFLQIAHRVLYYTQESRLIVAGCFAGGGLLMMLMGWLI